MFAKIIGASAATGAGIAVVSMAGKYVDENDDGKRFSLDGERFDQGTFMGRWKKMISNFDPATLLYSDSEIKIPCIKRSTAKCLLLTSRTMDWWVICCVVI